MKADRFIFALERLQPDDWQKFERFASAFLVADYPELRTVAASSGDLGRDAVLFSPTGDDTVVLQYSVTPKWSAKITQTANRLKDAVPTAALLIYVTNHSIGAQADTLKKDLRRIHGIVLDIHDRSWFTDRYHHTAARLALAEDLATEIVDPYLQGREVIEERATALSSYESKAAVVYLSLQWEDDTREKGLTKLCFEALVKAALRGTSSDRTMTRTAVKEQVRSIMPNHSQSVVDTQVDGAIGRLDKKSIKQRKQTDELYLSFEEVSRVKAQLTIKENKDALFRAEIDRTTRQEVGQVIGVDLQHLPALVERIRRVIETYLLHMGERFASQVSNGNFNSAVSTEINQVVANDLARHKDATGLGAKTIEITRRTAMIVLTSSSEAVQHYMRSLSDAYTLFAFLKVTPDVQEVVRKMFAYGEIWIDTSILLPVFAESLLPDEERNITKLIRVAHEAGLKLYVTDGVIEEIERHINRTLMYGHKIAVTWRGRVPFLFSMFALSNKHISGLDRWINTFCGTARPHDDIADYLRDELHIEQGSLIAYSNQASDDLKYAAEQVWHTAHEERRNAAGNDADPMMVDRLVRHDMENFLGAIQKRSQVSMNDLGFTVWWLTLDRTVKGIEEKLKQFMEELVPKTPVMSPDFLLNYLAFGPIRGQIKKSTEIGLPVTLETLLPDELPPDLLKLAHTVREECKDMEERLIRRRLRDELDAAKTRQGTVAAAGFSGIEGQIRNSLGQNK